MTAQAGYRADIDGLRALAVAAVVIFHAAGWLLPGGYVGVDIFFVISGFLIGGIIDREIGNGSFGFARFYARRARRILPALFVVIVSACVAGLLLLSARELREMSVEAAAALLGISNFKFWLRNDYFAGAAPLVPLLMTWSLGVEEQFYMLFPGLLLLVRRRSARIKMLTVATVTLLSLILSIVLTRTAPWAAFYLLPTRAWEMGAGALLAIWLVEKGEDRLPGPRLQDLTGLAGLAAIVIALFAFDEKTPFPGFAALLPVGGTVALIAARHGVVNRVLFASRPLVAIGLLSYSWYLWHWPMMAFARNASDTAPGDRVMLTIAALSLGVAWLSWRFVERRFRYAAVSSTVTLRRFGAGLSLFAALSLALFVAKGVPGRLSPTAQQADRMAKLASGDCQQSFGIVSLREDEHCMPKKGPAPIIAVMGDSHANALGFGLRGVAARNGYRLWEVQKSACFPLLGVTTAQERQPFHSRQCTQFLDTATTRLLREPSLSVVVLAGAWPAVDDQRFNLVENHQVGRHVDAATALRIGLPAMIERFQRAGKRVILVGDVPSFGHFHPLRHAFNVAIPARSLLYDIVDPAPFSGDRIALDRLDHRFDASRAYIRALAVRQKTGFVDIAAQFCDAQSCQHARNGVPMFVDVSHLSFMGSMALDWSEALPAAATNKEKIGG
ncbi:acyltransferase family protein [Sphingomonas sp. Leaf343]|uniref:acyltransferase family protein n=1 Tax=Sphingomonas sp. Leaf343 TaxID=1736345 RepID=UPI0006FFCE14|nr:acyltransferase family protein [Sphingomonas sp. Leaf343]KQR80211.1 hypothetical protein ASG07_15570 [Sphingomonas sp. Leaf343]